jgi:inorganic pyrophosphatase/exopolyphosphatase
LSKQKSAQGLSALFLAVVNIVELKSTLLLCGDNERSLGAASFPECKTNRADQPFSMDLGQRVSRKKDFLPSVNKAVKAGWTPVVVTQSN